MIEQVDVAIADPSYRIVVETDPTRGEKYIFSPLEQITFWLTHGRDPNQVDETQERMPFTTHITSNKQQEFTNALISALRLYRGEIHDVPVEGRQDVSSMLVGVYTHKIRGNPAVIIKESDGGLLVEHMWVDPSQMREGRLKQ